MADFYANLAATAKRLLTKYGQSATVTRENVGTVDPITGIGTPAADTTFTANVAVFDYSQSLVDGAMIQQGDQRVLVESTTEIKTGDVITVSSGDLTVINVTTLAPSGVVVIYELQVRY